MITTKQEIRYKSAPYGLVGVIPAGTECIPATNLPESDGPQYWVMPWTGMTDLETSWQINYGYLLGPDEVTFEMATA